MAYKLEVSIVDAGDGTIKVVHQFFGVTEQEVQTYKREHLADCGYFKAAEKDGRTIEELEEIDQDELPEVEEEDEDEDEDEEG
jgi:hypothetical protein